MDKLDITTGQMTKGVVALSFGAFGTWFVFERICAKNTNKFTPLIAVCSIAVLSYAISEMGHWKYESEVSQKKAV